MTPLRGLSLGLAGLAGLVILGHPDWTAEAAGWADRAALAMTLIGAVGAIAYGIGHRPERALLRFVQSPKVAWPAMVAGLMVFVVQRLL